MESLIGLLNGEVRFDLYDVWVLKPNQVNGFSIKVSYDYLGSLASQLENRCEAMLHGFFRVWKSWAPYKLVVFSWKFLQNRLPTRKNLLRRQFM